jgi:hypothetical protein
MGTKSITEKIKELTIVENKVDIKVRPQTKHLIPIKKGERLNPNGRPKGQRNYETIRREAIIAIGKQNNKTPEQIEEMLVAKGVSEALKGDFRFYKDDLDRVHGQATQKIAGDENGVPIQQTVIFIPKPFPSNE